MADMEGICHRVEVYQTKDGKIHSTPDDAEDHIVEQLKKVIDSFITPFCKNMDYTQKSNILDVLVGNVDNIRRLKTYIEKYVD